MSKSFLILKIKEAFTPKTLPLWALSLLIFSAFIGDKLTLFHFADADIGISLHKLYLIFLFAVLAVIRLVKKEFLSNLDRLQKLALGFMIFWAAYGSLLYLLVAERTSAAFVEMCYLYFNFLMVACVFMLLKTKRELDFFVSFLRVAMTVMVLLGLFEIMSGNHLWMSRLSTAVSAVSDENTNPFLATGLWNNENDFCFVLAVSGLLFSFWQTGLSRRRRVYYAAVQFCLFFIIVVNSSLIALLLYTVALIGSMLLARAKWQMLLPTVLAAVSLQTSLGGWLRNALITLYNNLLMGLNLQHDGLSSINRSVSDQFAAFADGTGSMFYRITLIAQGISIGISSFLIGVGPAQFSGYVGLAATGGYSNPHNWWIEIFAQYGILVFLGYAALSARLFFSSIKRTLRERSEPYAGLTGMIFLFFTCCVVPSSLIGLPFQWMIFAFFFCARRIGKAEGKAI